MRKFASVALASLMVLGSLAACGESQDDEQGVDTGVVVERKRKLVVVLEDDGEYDKHSIYKYSTKCPVGSRWPDCKE